MELHDLATYEFRNGESVAHLVVEKVVDHELHDRVMGRNESSTSKTREAAGRIFSMIEKHGGSIEIRARVKPHFFELPVCMRTKGVGGSNRGPSGLRCILA